MSLFVVFCNVIYSLNSQDFILMRDIVNSVSNLSISSEHVSRLQKLCDAITHLCQSLFMGSNDAHTTSKTRAPMDPHPNPGNTASLSSESVCTNYTKNNPSIIHASNHYNLDMQLQSESDNFPYTIFPSQNQISDAASPLLWNDNMMWRISPHTILPRMV